jgi:hypothetical protein
MKADPLLRAIPVVVLTSSNRDQDITDSYAGGASSFITKPGRYEELRFVIGQLLVLVRRYPALVDGAFIIIAWVGIKLLIEYFHGLGWIHFELPKWLSMGLIVVIFGLSFLYARKHGPVSDEATARAERETPSPL